MCRAGFGGQRANVPRSPKIVSHHRRSTARSPLEVSDAGPSRSSRLSASSSFSWYNRAHARPASAHRHCRPGRWLAKSCLANATSVGKAPWLGNSKPTPSARARWLRHGRSRSARDGRLDARLVAPSCFESFPRLRQDWALPFDLQGCFQVPASVRPS